MNQYYIWMDDDEFGPYSYQQLKDMDLLDFEDMDLFDFEDIYVRTTNESEWTSVKEYIFAEADTPGYRIDEYGQIIRDDPPTPTPTPTTNDGWNTFGKVLMTILVVGITIAIVAASSGIATPIAFGTFLCLREIWKE